MIDQDTQPDELEDDDLFEHHRIVVDAGQAMLRIDRFLDTKLATTSRTKLQSAIDAGGVKVNGQVVKASYKVKPVDLITVSLPHPPRDTNIIPQNIPLDIVFEDDDLMVVNKPAGMVVHPAHGNWDGTLVNALVYYLQNLPTTRNGEGRPGLVHRIDKDTSGLMVIAKTDFAMSHLARQFFEHTIERTYNALVWGVPDPENGMITGYIGRSTSDRKVMTVYDDETKGKWSVSHYKTLEALNYVSLVQCNLETGRTHQIRAHFRHVGHPLFNDATYGGDRVLRGNPNGTFKAFVDNAFALLPRQALHARSLGFEHPRTQEWYQFDSPLPADFQAALDKWRNKV
ncbi:RluA family pseudouridine synthase [Fibrivirga algicola]|uniref:Pseudouridine synthase n=1 Tax=Fibrivirga algicola TaxID=2950420 RepID=A0ABX0QGD8_9BACT|nr:RluA family pseudouridine synthase [Fibrivirga algicola]NID11112.1 RluA family pseudouridine synthase [Fibrivirga algicola]